ncbi:NB-ARC domain disease resistance protein [Trifolium medium]|uniref:NB-ARC domain disease resistance protein n=1 Tax=Trifolium medium TaxID=97028 RepID=A0A392NB87_9FABA|nr:NB-ARC domain disease resistance protein [Trifolium medium]
MLQNLETLDLRVSNSFYETPNDISKLRKLRHLLGYNMSLFQLKNAGIGGLESLQTLSEVIIDKDGIELIRELEKLRQLRKLSLVGVRREHGSALSSLLDKMRHLEKLRVGSKSRIQFDYEVIDLHLVSSPPMLRNLRLHGRLEKFPEWIPNLQNLVELLLTRSQLTDDPIKYLENMQSLLSLSIIDNAYEGESLHFHDGGFQKLKELYIKELPNLNSIIIDKGALHVLKKFELSSIPNLKEVPTGIQNLEKLEILNVWDVPLVEFYPKL